MNPRKSRIPGPVSPTVRHTASSNSLRVPPSPATSRSPSPSKPKTSRLRTKSSVVPSKDQEIPKPKPMVSIKDAIALKRAAAKKAQSKPDNLEEAIPDAHPPEESDVLGRKSIRETIEKSKSTGSLNLCARDPPLPCIPSALFEIVLGVTPEKLTSVPNEGELPPNPSKASRSTPAWYEAQDLVVLKASNNEIREIQPEITLFGSLKTLDLHNNKLETVPGTLPDLANLSILDLSHNSLKQLPDQIWTLPGLSYLNVSFNSLSSLDFSAPFRQGSARSDTTAAQFFPPQIERSKEPCPRLITLEVRGNRLTARSIGEQLPMSLTKVDFSENPIESENEPVLVQELIKRLARLQKLKELRFERANISNRSFPSDILSSISSPFPNVQLFDMGETRVSRPAFEDAMTCLGRELRWVGPSEDLSPDSIRAVVGTRDLREPWEIELETKAQSSRGRAAPRSAPSDVPTSEDAAVPKPSIRPPSPKEVTKEAWEIEAEQGLLTEGGRRKARIAAAAKAREEQEKKKTDQHQSPSSILHRVSSLLSSPQYYSANTHTLTLPVATATKLLTKQHARAFSFAAPSSFSGELEQDLAVPPQTLPLHLISELPYADTLRTLVCNSRRKDRTFTMPSSTNQPALPHLSDLQMEGCQLPNNVPVSNTDPDNPTAVATAQGSQPLLPLITTLFPSLTILNLSHNLLTSAALTSDVVAALIFAGPSKPGLRSLSLRGNRIDDLEGLESLANRFKGNREVEGYQLEELDIRENEISKLPAVLGLLPLDVFLVEGNVFRIPPRRIWEREGSRGLLSWLRGRLE